MCAEEGRHRVTLPSGTLPWTKSCFVCGEANPHGLQLRSRIENDRVVLDYTPRDRDRGWMHIVHGGITMTLMDEVMTWAAMLAVRGACVAAEMTSRLKSPVEVGQALRVEGYVSETKSRVVLTESRILDGEGRVLASATGKYMRMPADKALLCEDDFSWTDDTIHPREILG